MFPQLYICISYIGKAWLNYESKCVIGNVFTLLSHKFSNHCHILVI